MRTLRKRAVGSRLEEDKWREVYLILFPEVPVADIPSPFYDCDSPSEASRRFRRDLLRRVQEELLVEAGNVPNPVEQELLQRVAGIIRRCEHELLNQAQAPSIQSIHTERRASGGSTSSSHQATSALVPRSSAQGSSFSAPQPLSDHLNVPIIDHPTENMSQPPESTNGFGHAAWNSQLWADFSTGINWEEVFPLGSGIQYRSSDETGPLFSPPVWT
ncbi:hypothetical protein CFE70_007554 [Pyrenophora teres f. teres 0-1]|nr:hypothetical protein HRS9139_08576 [Pyrenophora teres f. teres]KAE8834562.1 hypothetical protein PTNB85_05895 [Pyrenophora teres f. teres]KAE8843958.1 hypothetical protein HRS9122_05061 [Pyrenophora teres f. teres]KAE8858986.1 hypothetical protein PTNB73_08466 [Pyrenophora teres f. teres]KAE8860849.1 hypothetical protein PTNB29_05944 [Pyrenophora teres f. teres]